MRVLILILPPGKSLEQLFPSFLIFSGERKTRLRIDKVIILVESPGRVQDVQSLVRQFLGLLSYTGARVTQGGSRRSTFQNSFYGRRPVKQNSK